MSNMLDSERGRPLPVLHSVWTGSRAQAFYHSHGNDDTFLGSKPTAT